MKRSAVLSRTGIGARSKPLRPVVRRLLTLALVAVAASTASASEWRLLRDEAGTRSYQRERADSPLLAFKAEGIIDAPIERVMSVLLDAERAGEWIPHLSVSEVRRWNTRPNDYVQFTRFDAPWPIRDRVFLSRVVVSVDPLSHETLIRYLNLQDVEDAALQEAVVRGSAIRGSAGGSYYRLRPIEGGRRTDFVGVSVADPNGAIPSWLVNWVGGSWAHETLLLLRRQVARPDVRVMPIIRGLYVRHPAHGPRL